MAQGENPAARAHRRRAAEPALTRYNRCMVETLPAVVEAAENTRSTPSLNSVRDIRKTVLPNGLTVLTESMPHMRSVAMGVWMATGSRDEQPAQNGLSHFVEHMVFKGTNG